MKSKTTNNWIVCRICLKQAPEKMRTIFDQNDEKDLTELILRCGGVPIKRFDHFPDKICNKCFRFLCIANKFRQTCQRSHQHLSKFIAPVEVDPRELEETVDPNIPIQLPEPTIELKMESYEPLTTDDDKIIKEELDEEIVEMYEPMKSDCSDDEEKIDRNIEGVMSMGDFEFLEEIADVTSSDSENETTSFTVKKSPKKKVAKKQQESDEEFVLEKETKKKRTPKKKTKESSYICDVCGNIYPSQSRLTEHIKLHRGLKPHECEICGHAFAQAQQLARHMNTHTGRRPYKCSYCPAAFADLSTRNKHHRIHTNERPYVCDVCGKTFTYTNTLKFHKMIHTGEKPHVCDICGKGFQQAYKMRNHRLVHEKQGIKREIPREVNSEQILEI